MKNTFKIKLTAIICLIGLIGFNANAQDADEKFSFDVSLNSDQFFGFYPFFQGGYAINNKTAFTFYGILWSGGTGGGWGNWTEFGMGVNLTPSEGLSINPQVAF